MLTVILSLIVFALVIAGMAIGVILGQKPIKGSCGGMSSLGMDTACDICGGDTKKCEEEQERQTNESKLKDNVTQTGLAYEVGKKKN